MSNGSATSIPSSTKCRTERQAVEAIQPLMAGSEQVVLEGSGHVAYYEQPQVFNTAVLDFIARRVVRG